MRLKTDENLSAEMVGLLRARGFDVTTVREEGLSGAPDNLVARAAAAESRALLTLDLGFGSPAVASTIPSGVVVLRLRHQAIDNQVQSAARLADHLDARDPAGEVWLLQEDRLRIHRHSPG